uniref:Uncharacterized protein LOC110197150 n=1 Tax=Phascolarctos cinereus TaxID=38626 RepID=A0A6P5J5K1_PHACI|nr:uncharacterized protein LOC110197150 [Phascolarctos cinereus]
MWQGLRPLTVLGARPEALPSVTSLYGVSLVECDLLIGSLVIGSKHAELGTSHFLAHQQPPHPQDQCSWLPDEDQQTLVPFLNRAPQRPVPTRVEGPTCLDAALLLLPRPSGPSICPDVEQVGGVGHPGPSSPEVHLGKLQMMGKLLSQHHRNPEASSSGSRCCLMEEFGSEQELCSRPGRPRDQEWVPARGRGSESWHQGLDCMDDFDSVGQDSSSTKLLSKDLKQDLSLTPNNPVDAPSYPRLPKTRRSNLPH